VPQVDIKFDVPVSAFDGVVSYGEKRGTQGVYVCPVRVFVWMRVGACVHRFMRIATRRAVMPSAVCSGEGGYAAATHASLRPGL
jgi:hypothetical protein